MTRPSGVTWTSVGRISAADMRPVASNSASRRLELVSSGPITRKLAASSLRRITSRSIVPSTRVASAVVAPGAGTATA